MAGNRGQFKPGKSGNPAGRPRKYTATSAAQRIDGWMNDLTGLGILGRDKTLGSAANQPFQIDAISLEAALNLWRGDAIAKRIVETIPNEALREGWDLVIGDDDAIERYVPPNPSPAPTAQPKQPGRMDASEGKDLAETLTKRLEDLGFLAVLREVMNYERAFGGGAILLGANDYAADLREPLDLARVQSLDWVTPLEPRELVPRYYYNDPFAPKFGQPSIYQLNPYSVGPAFDGTVPRYCEIHESRLIVFPGTRVSRRAVSSTGTFGWGDSVFTTVIRELRDYNTAHSSGVALLQDFAQAVLKVKDLAETVAADGAGAFLQKMTSIDVARSILRMIVVDADGEEFERKATPMTGFPEMLDRSAQRLAAACDMPLTLLMGTSPAGMNATGESDVRFFYDRISSVRKHRVAPAIMRAVRILMAIAGENPDEINHSVKFPPLWQPTQKEIAEAHYTQAQADAVYLDRDVVSPEEIAASRFGGDAYSFETRIDFDARAAQEAIAPPTVDADPAPDPTATCVCPLCSATVPCAPRCAQCGEALPASGTAKNDPDQPIRPEE